MEKPEFGEIIRPGGNPPAVVVGSLASGLSPVSVSKSRAY